MGDTSAHSGRCPIGSTTSSVSMCASMSNHVFTGRYVWEQVRNPWQALEVARWGPCAPRLLGSGRCSVTGRCGEAPQTSSCRESHTSTGGRMLSTHTCEGGLDQLNTKSLSKQACMHHACVHSDHPCLSFFSSARSVRTVCCVCATCSAVHAAWHVRCAVDLLDMWTSIRSAAPVIHARAYIPAGSLLRCSP